MNPVAAAAAREVRSPLLGYPVAVGAHPAQGVDPRQLPVDTSPEVVGAVFYVTDLPSEVQWFDVSAITISALVIAVLATIYPSRRAAAVAPAEALRYE